MTAVAVSGLAAGGAGPRRQGVGDGGTGGLGPRVRVMGLLEKDLEYLLCRALYPLALSVLSDRLCT